MRKSIVIGSDRDLRSWLFEAEEAPAGGAPDEKAKKEAEDILNSTDVSQTVGLINKASPETIKILGAGDKDGDEADDSIEVGSESVVKVSGLMPTQNFISIWKSVSWPLSRIDALNANNSGDPTGKGKSIVIDGNLVIDGHHRWSSVVAITGKDSGNILAQNVTFPGSGPLQKLAKAQISIVGALARKGLYKGAVPSAAGGEASDNILGATSEQIASLLNANINKGGLDPVNSEPLLGDKYMAQVVNEPIAAELFGLTPTDDAATARNKIIQKVSQNLSSLPKGQGPAREYMPQFDDDPKSVNPPGIKFKHVAPLIQKGEINVSNPSVASGESKKASEPEQGELPLKESLKESRLVYGFERRSSLPGIRRRY